MDIKEKAQETIKQLLASPFPEIASLAQRTVDLKLQLIDNKISESEFEELLTDLQSLSDLNQNVIEIERWREIVEAATILNIIRQWAPLL